MAPASDYRIQDFSEKSDPLLLKEIFILNQANTPAVGSLDSIDHLKNLLSKSIKNLFISNQNSLVGFIVCFRENSNYESENYKFFSQSEKTFMYIDRVAIDKEFRRNRLAQELYNNIEKICIEKKLPLCCEVNTFPINKPSIDFHKKLGFYEVGSNDFTANSVVYLKKDIYK